MKLLQDILVATDFTESSDRAIKTSILLAKKFKSRITLMHVALEESVSDDTRVLIEQSINNKLADIKEKISKDDVYVSEVISEKGVAFEKIIQVAQGKNVNLIMVGSGSKDSNDNFKLGTTAEKLIRKNQIPVWVVKNEEVVNPVSKILCPVDFSDASLRAFLNAITIAEKFNSEISIVHVFEPVTITSARFSVDEEEENRKRKQNKEKELNNFINNYKPDNITCNIQLLMGDPVVEIFKAIKNNESDLLIMGTTGKTGLSKLLMGSVTEKVTRELPCSFITTKARDITDNYLESNLSAIESILVPAKKLLKEKKFEQAVEKFIIGIKQFPDNIPLIQGIISSYKALGDNNKAKYYQNYGRQIVKRLWGNDYLDIIKFD